MCVGSPVDDLWRQLTALVASRRQGRKVTVEPGQEHFCRQQVRTVCLVSSDSSGGQCTQLLSDGTRSSVIVALRDLPPPWKNGEGSHKKQDQHYKVAAMRPTSNCADNSWPISGIKILIKYETTEALLNGSSSVTYTGDHNYWASGRKCAARGLFALSSIPSITTRSI